MVRILKSTLVRVSGIAFLSAIGLTLLLPSLASALPLHAILLSSTPTKDAVLRTPPKQVQMVFSEDLNPALSTVQVINAERQRVDKNDPHVNAGNTREMDISLQANLQPDVYIVVWRTDSADDGHVLLGSFIFTVINPDGSVPKLSPGADPSQGLLGNTNTSSPGTLDGPTFFNFVMVTLVELAATFWVAGQLWANFVLQTVSEKHPEERELNKQIEQRFERRFSLPTLVLLLLANLGVLYGQVLVLTGNNWSSAFSFQLLSEQASSGRFGTYWLVRMVVLLLALLVGLYMVLSKRRPPAISQALPLVNLFLGSLLFIALTMSGHAAAVSAVFVPYSVVIDWLHLLGSALWVGGMLYILLLYLPLLKKRPVAEQARSFLAILVQYSPLAIAGVVILAATGPLNATFHLTSLQQFISTAYGRTLVVKIVLVGALLATSAFHVGWLRPRIKKEYQKYTYVQGRLGALQTRANGAVADQDLELVASTVAEAGEKPAKSQAYTDGAPVDDRKQKLLAQQVRLRSERLTKKTGLMARILGWEPWLGIAVIVCVGLLNVFGGTLTTYTPPQNTNNSTTFNSTAKTSDGKYSVSLNVDPNRFGTNVFTVHITDAQSGQPLGANQAGVTIYTTMLDMAMGTDSLNLQSDGKGGFTGSGDLAMGGDWQIQVQIRTLDNTLHKVSFKIYAPF